MYGHRIREPLDIDSDALIDLTLESTNNIEVNGYPSEPAQYRPARIDAIDAIKLAAIYMKRQYDAKHMPKFFNVGDHVAFRLHRGLTSLA